MSAHMAEPDVLVPPENFATASLRNAIVVPGNIVVYGFTVYSSLASQQWIHVFDASAVPANATVPLFSWSLAANSGAGFSWTDNGRRFKTGLVLANSTTETALTIGAVNCFFDVQYQRLSDLYLPVSEAD